MHLNKALLEILRKLPLEELITKGVEYRSIQDNRPYINYIPFFQERLPEMFGFVSAKEIVRALQEIYEDQETAPDAKEKINRIFVQMDPRDQNYRWGECHCPSCRGRFYLLRIPYSNN